MDWIDSLRVVDLKEELKKRNLPVSGKKAELAARLEEAVQAEGGAEGPEPKQPAQEAADQEEEEPARQTQSEQAVADGPEQNNAQKEAEEETAAAVATETADHPVSNNSDAADLDVLHEKAAETAVAVEAEDGRPVREEALQPAVAEVEDEVKAAEFTAVAEEMAEAQPVTAVESVVGEDKEPAGPDDAPLDGSTAEPLHPAQTSNERHVPDPIPAVEEAPAGLPAINIAQAVVEEPISATPSREERLPAMQASTAMLLQAALLAPQAAVPEAAQDAEMEEEAVDFEADDMEEDTTAAAKQSSKAEEHEENGVKVARKAELSQDERDSKRQRQDNDGGASRRKREPIPLFKPRDRDSTPRAAGLKSQPSSEKKSVFERIGTTGGGDAAPAGAGAPPTRTKPTRALLVTGFVRPFTVVAAQNLFKTYGEMEKMWMPSIRDKAYVLYATEEAAEAARQATHGLEWPHGNKTSLRPKFVPVEEAEAAVNTDGKDLPTRKSGLGASNSGVNAAMAAAATATAAAPLEKKRSDRGPNGVMPDATRGKAEVSTAEVPQKEEEKGVGLEDLFRRTETTPRLYWLPLADEQAQAKLKERRAKEAGLVSRH